MEFDSCYTSYVLSYYSSEMSIIMGLLSLLFLSLHLPSHCFYKKKGCVCLFTTKKIVIWDKTFLMTTKTVGNLTVGLEECANILVFVKYDNNQTVGL